MGIRIMDISTTNGSGTPVLKERIIGATAEMYMTFFIGNGFDLNLGLKTRDVLKRRTYIRRTEYIRKLFEEKMGRLR